MTNERRTSYGGAWNEEQSRTKGARDASQTLEPQVLLSLVYFITLPIIIYR
jgi:hypothetical protein